MGKLFEERFLTDRRWESGKECLNMKDINQPPNDYSENMENWINDLTTFISDFPKEWEEILREYEKQVKSREIYNSNLAYFRDDEGYLRMVDERGIYLTIRIQGNDKVETLKMVADTILQKWKWGFKEYIAYTHFDREERVKCLNMIKVEVARCSGIEKDFIHVSCESDYGESSFQKVDLYIDLLNRTYAIL